MKCSLIWAKIGCEVFPILARFPTPHTPLLSARTNSRACHGATANRDWKLLRRHDQFLEQRHGEDGCIEESLRLRKVTIAGDEELGVGG
jgi:hypothetical protein